MKTAPAFPSRILIDLGKAYHWTFNKKGRLTLHTKPINKCKRVHLTKSGERA
jgi:hypothetical protein